MLLIFPIILCSNSRRYHLLCFAFLPIMLESMIDIDVKKCLESLAVCLEIAYSLREGNVRIIQFSHT